MPHRAQSLDHAELLESMTWCRDLARRLARDAHQGDDAAQEVWLSAVRSGSLGRSVGVRLRGWLGRAASNRIRERGRSEASRRSREERCARPEAQESVLDVLERGEVQRQILDAVLDLPEPHASTVLQRYFDGLSCAQIARLEGVSGEVVRKRLSRALSALRGKLERKLGGDGAWLAALAPLLVPRRPPGAASLLETTVGAPAMRWAFASALVGAAAYGVLAVGPSSGGGSWLPEEPQLASGGVVATEGTVSLPRIEAADARRPAVRRSRPAEASAKVALRGRVLDCLGEPVTGVAVHGAPARIEGVGEGFPEARTGADGRFELRASPSLERIVVCEPGLATVFAGSGRRVGDDEVVLLVAPAIELAGRVVDTEGNALPDARLRLENPEGLGAGLEAVLDHSEELVFRERTDGDGAFDLGEVPWVEGALLRLQREGFEALTLPVPRASDRGLLLTLARRELAGAFLDGVVLGPDGRAVEGALVSSGFDTTRTEADGTFQVTAPNPSSASPTAGRPRVTAMKRGYRSASRDLDADATAGIVVLRLPGEVRSIAGRVVDELGAGIADAKVWLADPTLLGALDGRPAFVEPLQVSEDPPLWSWVRSGPDGRFRIDGVDERTYRVAALDVATLAQGEAQAGPHAEPTIVVPTCRVTRGLSGRVVDVFGRPVRGAAVTLYKRTRHVRVGEAHEWVDEQTHAPVLTDVDGRFRLPVVPWEGPRIRVDGPGVVSAHYTLDAESPEPQTLIVSPRTHLRVELISADSGIDEVRLLDVRGAAVDVGILRGTELELARSAAVFGDRTHLLVVHGDAALLALCSEGVEVHREPLALRPGELNLLRY